jgi:hypothetical protein
MNFFDVDPFENLGEELIFGREIEPGAVAPWRHFPPDFLRT